jgi:hypothetical protein
MHNSGNYVDTGEMSICFFCVPVVDPKKALLRERTTKHQVSWRRHSGGSFGGRGKSFAAGKRPGEFKLAILAGGLL